MTSSFRLLLLLIAAALLLQGCGDGASTGGGAADAAVGPDAPDASDGVGCSAYAVRAPAPELFIGPDGLQNRLIGEIDAADSELWVMMYLVTMDEFVDAFVRAHQRGVDVRVMLDYGHEGNADARQDLTAAGVPLRDAPVGFTHAHTKAMLIDGRRAVIMSSNLNYYSMTEERNYGVIDTDPDDVADLRAIFESDWADDGSYPDLSCTRLLVSPVNARTRMLEHVNRAEQTLDLSVMYISEEGLRNAVIERHQDGVAVRVLLADPAWIDSNVETIAALEAAGVPARVAQGIQLHAKLVVSDGVPFVGSQNLSFTSLNRNREIGVMVNDQNSAAAARDQFDTDWQSGSTP